jgi:hypothetical protein
MANTILAPRIFLRLSHLPEFQGSGLSAALSLGSEIPGLVVQKSGKPLDAFTMVTLNIL